MINATQVRKIVGPKVAEVIRNFGANITFNRSDRGGGSLTIGGPTFDVPFSFTCHGVVVPVSRRTRAYDESFRPNTLLPETTHVIIIDPESFLTDDRPSTGDTAKIGETSYKVEGFSSFSPDDGPSMFYEVEVSR